MSTSLDCTNGLSACLKAASLIQWACSGFKLGSVIQTETALCQLPYLFYIVMTSLYKNNVCVVLQAKRYVIFVVSL